MQRGDVRAAHLEHEVQFRRSASSSSSWGELYGFLGMALGVAAMLLKQRWLALAALAAHVASWAHLRIADRSLSSMLTGVSVSLLALVSLHAQPLMQQQQQQAKTT